MLSDQKILYTLLEMLLIPMAASLSNDTFYSDRRFLTPFMNAFCFNHRHLPVANTLLWTFLSLTCTLLPEHECSEFWASQAEGKSHRQPSLKYRRYQNKE